MKYLFSLFLSLFWAGSALAGDVKVPLLCFYQIAPHDVNLKNVKAFDIAQNKEYQLPGRWMRGSESSGYNVIMRNMFYTDITHEQLLKLCNDTFARNKISASLIMYRAKGAYDYPVWTNEPAVNKTQLNRIVAFGDSYSDMHNVYISSNKALAQPRAGYLTGRFTNGRNWLDYLSGMLNVPVNNWAFRGGYITNSMESIYENPFHGVDAEVNSWSESMGYIKKYNDKPQNYHPENTLFIVFTGADDIVRYDVSYDKKGKSVPWPDYKALLEDERAALSKIITSGGKNILLVNLPDLSRAPLYKLVKFEKGTKTDPQFIQSQIEEFNKGLITLSNSFPGVKIQLLDAHKLVTDIVKNPVNYGMTNINDTCLNVDEHNKQPYANGLYAYNNKLRESCQYNYEKHVFFDYTHLTTEIHKQLADYAFCFINRDTAFKTVLAADKFRSPPDCLKYQSLY